MLGIQTLDANCHARSRTQNRMKLGRTKTVRNNRRRTHVLSDCAVRSSVLSTGAVSSPLIGATRCFASTDHGGVVCGSLSTAGDWPVKAWPSRLVGRSEER